MRAFSKVLFGAFGSTEKVKIDPSKIEWDEHIIKPKMQKSFSRRKVSPKMKIELDHEVLVSEGTTLSEDQLKDVRLVTVQPDGRVIFGIPSLFELCKAKVPQKVDDDVIMPPTKE